MKTVSIETAKADSEVTKSVSTQYQIWFRRFYLFKERSYSPSINISSCCDEGSYSVVDVDKFALDTTAPVRLTYQPDATTKPWKGNSYFHGEADNTLVINVFKLLRFAV